MPVNFKYVSNCALCTGNNLSIAFISIINAFVNDDVEPVAAVKLKSFIIYRNRHLATKREIVSCKLVAKTLLIRRFEHPRSYAPQLPARSPAG